MAQSKDITDWDLCPSTAANMDTNWWEFPLENVSSVDAGVERLQFANVRTVIITRQKYSTYWNFSNLAFQLSLVVV